MRLLAMIAVCATLIIGSPAAQSDAARSPQLTKQLVSAMSARQLDAIAAADPDEPGRFLAALVFPDVQLLAVSARHQSVEYLKMQISKKEFRDVYIVLQEGIPASRLLVHDMGCDGIQAGGDNVDIFYEGKNQKTLFDGKWEAQSLTEEAYNAKLKEADTKYARVLTVLLDAAKKVPVPTKP